MGPSVGLTGREAHLRLTRFGFNDIEDHERRGLGRTLRSVATEPMFLLLTGAAVLYLLIGDPAEGLLLAGFALLTVGMVIVQERRSEHALEALRELSVPQVSALRDGVLVRLSARELVPGDVFLIAEGERVAADAVLREAASTLALDESLLTGESVPVRKRCHAGPVPDAGAAPGGDETPWVFAGTLVVAGHGRAEVIATGRHTHMGGIGASLAAIDRAPTPLEAQLRRLVRRFGLAALVISLLLVLWHGLLRGQWLQGVLSGIALGMAMMPEEFPMALTVFMALGAWRLARLQVLARRPAVIEALGAATVLCVDKTGTLTENRMRLSRLVTPEGAVTVVGAAPLPESAHRLLEFAVLASRRDSADPMDRAVLAAGDTLLTGTEHLHPDWQLEREYPLAATLLAMSLVWSTPQGARRVGAKGAPEAIADLCHLSPEDTAALLQRVQGLASQGLRVLALAEAGEATHASAPPQHQHDHAFTLLGLLAFEDPLRPSVPAAVAQARGAGIDVVMITGDHATTALAIARQAGLDTAPGALLGEQLQSMDDAALQAAVQRVRVYARVTPEQKLRLVRAYRACGETVAMTGDGVNDAPALKAAHIGIAMGRRGTDVAREAAGLVLLDEDLGCIVDGMRMGRRIFDNLRKVTVYITAIHVPIAGLALLPILLGLPPLLLPVHVVITEMVIDPVCSLAFEGAPAAPDIMQRPPRGPREGLIDRAMLLRGLLQGGAVLGAVLAIDGVALWSGTHEDKARTLAMAALTVGNLLLVVVNATAGLGWRALGQRAFRPFWGVAGAAGAAFVVALAVPAVRRLLHFGVPDLGAVVLSALAVGLAVGVGAVVGEAAARWLRPAV